MSHLRGKAFPPAFLTSYAAVYMVPGSLGWGSAVFAKIQTFAPSLAHLIAIARPIPLDAPVMTTVFPLRGRSASVLIVEASSSSLYIG